jgi:hypothetical protein
VGGRLQRVSRGEAGQTRQRLVDLRVVLHRAGAERVQPEVDRGVPRREPREVADHVDFGQLGKPGQVAAQHLGVEGVGRIGIGDVEIRERVAGAAAHAAFEEQRLLPRESAGRVSDGLGAEIVARVAHGWAPAAPAPAAARRATSWSIASRLASSVAHTSNAGPRSGS